MNRMIAPRERSGGGEDRDRESDEHPEWLEGPERRTTRAVRRLGAWGRWLPAAAAAGITAVLILGLVSGRERRELRGPGPAPGWFPVARGQICFLGEWEGFKLLRSWENPGRFRLEDRADAFETGDVEAVLRMFLRERLAGVGLGEPVRIQLIETFGPAYHEAPVAVRGVERGDWIFALREVERGRETWYESVGYGSAGYERFGVEPLCGPPPGPAAAAPPLPRETIAARSTEDLKEKLVREIARDLARSLSSM
jgi:hypothetical protein